MSKLYTFDRSLAECLQPSTSLRPHSRNQSWKVVGHTVSQFLGKLASS